MDTKQIIQKWYRLLEFPEKYDSAFENALQQYSIAEDTCIESYDTNCTDGAQNLLSYLYMCEKTEQLYEQKNISRTILISTLKDIRVWTDHYYETGKPFYLGELGWLKHHLTAELFKLGRLQFAFGKAHCDVPQLGVKKGEPIIEVHIDNRGPLLPAACDDSFAQAKQFFKTYFPEYRYKAFTCHSWLLGSNMLQLVPESSNILKFRQRFYLTDETPCDDIIKYVFRWNTRRETLAREQPHNAFAEMVKEKALHGEEFYIGYGFIANQKEPTTV